MMLEVKVKDELIGSRSLTSSIASLSYSYSHFVLLELVKTFN